MTGKPDKYFQSCVRALADVEAELSATKAALDELTAFTKQLSDALLTVRPLGGSELFVRHGSGDNEQYFADHEYLKNEIEREKRGYYDAICGEVRAQKRAEAAEARVAKLEAALNEIKAEFPVLASQSQPIVGGRLSRSQRKWKQANRIVTTISAALLQEAGKQ